MTFQNTIYLLTTGTGSSGDEWDVISIHKTKQGAENAKTEYQKPIIQTDGSTYQFDANVETWPVEE